MGDPSPTGPVAAVVVVVPARDEAHLIESSLRSIAFAVHDDLPLAQVLVVVVDDHSTDATARLAADTLSAAGVAHLVVSTVQGTAGGARADGVRAALPHLRASPDQTWVLSTDADTVVPADWVRRYLVHAEHGALAVAGVVTLRTDTDTDTDTGADLDRLRVAWWAAYGPTLTADGTHPHVHAANMGVRLDVLQAVGGIPAVARGEDRELWRWLRAAGVVPIADAELVVATSARLRGRVPEGFAHALGRLGGVHA
ncbi:glycosyltransferase family 2 protein [soil metagenome]